MRVFTGDSYARDSRGAQPYMRQFVGKCENLSGLVVVRIDANKRRTLITYGESTEFFIADRAMMVPSNHPVTHNRYASTLSQANEARVKSLPSLVITSLP